MGQVADIMLASANICRVNAEGVLKGIDPATFARFATQNGKPVQSNHPAFVFGHLSTYPKRIATALGVNTIDNPPTFEDLFKAGVTCVDDPNGTIYPNREVILNHYFKAYDAVQALIARTSDADFLKPNPNEGRSRELFPTIGAMTTFILGGHQMMHIGQVSAWRRFMGLGSAF
jgi:hypothetical protein